MKKGNLYYYFRSKEDILFACHQVLARQAAGHPRAHRADSHGHRNDKLRDLIVAFVHTILDELHGTALFLDLEALTPGHRRAVIARRDLFDRGLRHVLEEGIGVGRFGVGRSEAAVVRHPRRRQLDSALVQPERPVLVARSRRSVRRLPDRRPAVAIIETMPRIIPLDGRAAA